MNVHLASISGIIYLFLSSKMDYNNTTSELSPTICEEHSATAIQICDTVIWLFENVFQTIIGVCGLMANSLAIPILSSKEMSSIFNRLLVLLAVFDNIYIICSIFAAVKKSTPHR